MDSLRQKYQLGHIVDAGRTEFEKMKLMLDWVSRRFEHHSNNACKGRDALTILDEGEQGAQFRCVEYARVFANCMDAMGYPARTIGLTRFGTGFGTPLGHVCAEVWSNQYQKWIFFDGQNDAWWESRGVPLNAEECRRLFVAGRDSELVFVGQRRDWNYTQMSREWVSYFYHLDYGNNVAFFDTASTREQRNFELMSDAIVPELFSQGLPENLPLSSDEEAAYPRFNQTTIRLKHTNFTSPSDTLNVLLKHTMPWFEKFMVRLNGSYWKESTGNFQWILDKGENSIEAKAVNLAGAEGNVSRIVLRNNILKRP
jgi:hypothetical protein